MNRKFDYAEFEGMTVAEIASRTAKHPVDVFLDISVAETLKTDFQTPEVMPAQDKMREVVQARYAIPGISDGGAHTKFITLGTYATDFIVNHVREFGFIDLEEAHWRLSTYPALTIGLSDRGFLKPGAPADVIVYDYEKLGSGISEVAHDYPAGEWRRVRKAQGYRYIFVNGALTFVDGECTGAMPGRLLNHSSEAAFILAAA